MTIHTRTISSSSRFIGPGPTTSYFFTRSLNASSRGGGVKSSTSLTNLRGSHRSLRTARIFLIPHHIRHHRIASYAPRNAHFYRISNHCIRSTCPAGLYSAHHPKGNSNVAVHYTSVSGIPSLGRGVSVVTILTHLLYPFFLFLLCLPHLLELYSSPFFRLCLPSLSLSLLVSSLSLSLSLDLSLYACHIGYAIEYCSGIMDLLFLLPRSSGRPDRWKLRL